LETLVNVYDSAEWKNLMKIYKFALMEITTKLYILNEELEVFHLHNPIEHIKSRVKSMDSLTEKLIRRGYEVNIENAKEFINDIAGARIICSFTSDIYTIYELIKKHSDLKVVEVKDYIKNPKPNGYRSLHLLVKVPIFCNQSIPLTSF